MRLSRSFFEWSVVASVLLLGCTPSIGDSCKLHTDCSATGNRLCETNLPGGYCTIFNCEPESCPSEAACVAFGVAPSTKLTCAVTQQQRLERSFCMARCSGDSSCRTGYNCVDLTGPDNIWGAAVLDNDRGHKICTVKATPTADATTKAFLASAKDQVCSPPLAASFPPYPPDAAVSDAMSIAPRDGAPRPGSDGRVPSSDAGHVAPDAQNGP